MFLPPGLRASQRILIFLFAAAKLVADLPYGLLNPVSGSVSEGVSALKIGNQNRARSRGERSEQWMLVAMILCSGIVFLQSSVINVALPSIGRAFSTGLSGLQWVVDGYLITLSAFLILGGSLGDRYGRRRMMLIGLAGFGLTSVACGVAPTVSWLIGARLLQGLAGALLVPGSLAIIRAVYTEREARGEAIGQWSGWSGIVTVVGPLLGGWLVDNLSWRWIFFVIGPLITAALWLMLRFVPESRARDVPRRLDWFGAALIALGLGGAAYGLIEAPVVGWAAPSVLAAVGAGLASLLVLPVVEARKQDPMVPLELFGSRNFTGANVTTLGVYFALQGTTFLVVLYLQNVVGYSALRAGLVLAPISLLLLVLSPIFGRLSGRRGARWVMTGGPLVCAVGLLLFARLHPRAQFWTAILPAVVVFGLGMSATVAPLTDTVMSAVSDERSGVAAAFNNVVSRVAGLLAVAGLGAVVTLSLNASIVSRIERQPLSCSVAAALEGVRDEASGDFDVEELPHGVREVVTSVYTEAFRRAMIVSASTAAAGGVAAALTIRDGARRQAKDEEEVD